MGRLPLGEAGPKGLKGQGMKSRRPEAAFFFSALSPAPPVFPGESLPAYRFSHLYRVHFINQPHRCLVPNPVLVPFLLIFDLYLLDIPSGALRHLPALRGGPLLPLESIVLSTFRQLVPHVSQNVLEQASPSGKLARRA